MSEWKTLDIAPKDKAILLFCPWADTPDSGGTPGHPEANKIVNHGRVVGQWSEAMNGWSSQIPGGQLVPVYPSRWTDILDEPTT